MQLEKGPVDPALLKRFRAEFGQDPLVSVRVPGRVNIIGERETPLAFVHKIKIRLRILFFRY